MKITLVALLVLAVVVLGYDRMRRVRLDFKSLRGEIVTVGRGDLDIPITANGQIAANSRHEIKSQASGKVVAIHYRPGERVQSGDLFLQLEKDEEQRSVDRAKAEVTRTGATYESARIRLRKLADVGMAQARAKIVQAQAQLDLAEFNFQKAADLEAQEMLSPEEMIRNRSTYAESKAGLELAESSLRDTEFAMELAEQEVVLAEAAFNQAKTTRGDAEERLAETDVFAPVDGIVVRVNTQVGAVIQSGMSTFGTGTLLAEVADVSALYVHTEVDEADIGEVRKLAPPNARPERTTLDTDDSGPQPGTPVKVHVEAFHDEEFSGVIERIHPDVHSRASSVVTYRVDILLTSENRDKLFLGMQADVEFVHRSAENVLLVPCSAVRKGEGGETGVYLPRKGPDGQDADPRFVVVRVGLGNGIYTEVVDGLTEGAEVYTKLPLKTEREQRDDER